MISPSAQSTSLPLVPAILPRTGIRDVLLVTAAVVLLTLSAKIQIPMWPVPMTMQTYVVLVIGMGYGTRLGVLAVVTYVVLGALGLPVFAGTPERGLGLAYLFGPTGGYLLGFVLAAGVCGALARRRWDRRFLACVGAMTFAHAVIFACGVTWLASLVGWQKAVAVGFTPFIAATIIKTILAAVSLPAAWHAVRNKTMRDARRPHDRSDR